MKNLKLILPILSLLLLGACSAKKTATLPPTANEVNFRFDSHRLLSKYAGTLEENLTYLQANPEAIIMLEGHTDLIGTDDYNLDLGDKRARAIKSYFIQNGIDPKRIITVSYGEEKPKEGKYYNHRDNRRVVILDPDET